MIILSSPHLHWRQKLSTAPADMAWGNLLCTNSAIGVHLKKTQQSCIKEPRGSFRSSNTPCSAAASASEGGYNFSPLHPMKRNETCSNMELRWHWDGTNSNPVSFPVPLEKSTSLHIISITRNSPVLSKNFFHKVIKYITETVSYLPCCLSQMIKTSILWVLETFWVFLILCQYSPPNYTVLTEVYTTTMCLLILFFWTPLSS